MHLNACEIEFYYSAILSDESLKPILRKDVCFMNAELWEFIKFNFFPFSPMRRIAPTVFEIYIAQIWNKINPLERISLRATNIFSDYFEYDTPFIVKVIIIN